MAPRRIARRRAALRRAAADPGAVSAEPQLGRRDLPGDRAGPPPRLRVRHRGLGISARHALLDIAWDDRRADAAVAPDRRRTGLLLAADRHRPRAAGERPRAVLLFVGAPLVWAGSLARRRHCRRGRAGACLFRRPRADRGRRRAYPDHRLLAARPGLRDGLAAAIVRRGPSVRAGLPAAHPARAGRRDHRALAALARVANKAGRGARRRARRHHGRSNARLGDARLPARLARAQPALQPCLRRRQRIRHLALGLLPLPRSDHLASRPRACAARRVRGAPIAGSADRRRRDRRDPFRDPAQGIPLHLSRSRPADGAGGDRRRAVGGVGRASIRRPWRPRRHCYCGLHRGRSGLLGIDRASGVDERCFRRSAPPRTRQSCRGILCGAPPGTVRPRPLWQHARLRLDGVWRLHLSAPPGADVFAKGRG